MTTTILQRLFTVNPKRIHPFNSNSHEIRPHGDPQAFEEWMAEVEAGKATRVFVHLVQVAGTDVWFDAVLRDGANGNILSLLHCRREVSRYSSVLAILDVCLSQALAMAERYCVDFRNDLTGAHTPEGVAYSRLIDELLAVRHEGGV